MDYGNDPYKQQNNPPPVAYQPTHHQSVAVTVGQTGSYHVPWNWCHFVTSVIAFCCCQPFGLIALVMSLLAYSDHKAKDFDRAQSKRKCGLGFAIAAIILGVLGLIIFIAAYAVAISYAVSATDSWRDQANNWNNNWN